MASALPPARLRALYRALLRELPPRPVLAHPRAPLHARLRAAFTPTTTHAHDYAEAVQLLAYLRYQRQYAALLERYNPGVDLDDEERLRLTARRVGMDMPVAYARQDS